MTNVVDIHKQVMIGGNEVFRIDKEPTKLYLGHEEYFAITMDKGCAAFFSIVVKEDAKEEKYEGLVIHRVMENSHLQVV